MDDSQATEIVDLLSDDSSSSEDLAQKFSHGVSQLSGLSRKRGRSQSNAAADEDLPETEIGDTSCHTPIVNTDDFQLVAPLDGLCLIHLSVPPDEQAGLEEVSPSELQMVLPQLNPPDKCLSLQQLLHPQLQHVFSGAGVQSLLATTFVGGVPSALRPFVYGAGGPPHQVDEDEIATPAAPVCPITIVKHSGDQKGRAEAAIMPIPTRTGHSMCVVQPPLPRSMHYGTAHSKVILVRWGPGILHPHGTLRVIVLTANLCDYDLHDCYQCAWAQDLPVCAAPAAAAAAAAASSSDAPGQNESAAWQSCSCGGTQHRLRMASGSSDHGQFLRQVLVGGMGVPAARVDSLIHNVDWSQCAVDFVATVAGLHVQPQQLLENGLYRLAYVRGRQRAEELSICDGFEPLKRPTSSAADSSSMPVQPIWSQVSSLGSMLDATFNLSHLLLAANGALDARKWGKQGPHAAEMSKLAPHCDIVAAKPGESTRASHRTSASLRQLCEAAASLAPPTAAQRRTGNISALWKSEAGAAPAVSSAVKLFWPTVQFIRGTRHGSVGNVLMQETHWKSNSFPQQLVHAFQLNPKWHGAHSSGVEGRPSAAAPAAAAKGAAAQNSDEDASPRCAPGLASPLSSHSKLLGPQRPSDNSDWGAWMVSPGQAQGSRSRIRRWRDWLYVGSHNLSRSAWGALQKSSAHGGATAMSCNNHEFGVVFRPVFIEQMVSGGCSCTHPHEAVGRQAPAFTFVHDLNAPSLLERKQQPWTQQHIQADRAAMMARMQANMMGAAGL